VSLLGVLCLDRVSICFVTVTRDGEDARMGRRDVTSSVRDDYGWLPRYVGNQSPTSSWWQKVRRSLLLCYY